MSVFKVFDVAGSGMSAQMLRLNTVASNLANAESIVTNKEDVYQARHPVFESIMQEVGSSDEVATVKVREVMQEETAAIPHYRPNHPLSNEDGYVFSPNIDAVAEMADMISASRSYQNNVEVLATAKEMLLRTLQLGQS